MAILLVMLLLGIQTGCGGPAASEEGNGEKPRTTTGDETEPVEESQVTAMGRYMETGLPLPEGSSYLGRTMTLLSDGSLAYYDADSGLSVSSDMGESWEKRYETRELTGDFFEEVPYITNAAIGPDGSLAMLALVFSEGESSTATVLVADPEGNVTDIPATFADGDRPERLSWKEEGELYSASIRGRVCRIDTEKRELKELFTASDWVEILAFSGEKILLLENSGVEIYDLEKGAPEPGDEVLNEFCETAFDNQLGTIGESYGGLLLTEGEEVVYVVCRDGVFRHVLGGSAMEEFVDGRFSTLADTRAGLCAFLSLEDGDFLLLTTKEELIRLSYDPDEPSVPEEQLTVYSLHEMERIRQAISVYQKQNPDVWVNYEIGMDPDSAITLTDALKNLNVELMGGDGPDVLILDGMDENVYIEKGMLADLSAFADPLSGDGTLLPQIEKCFRGEEGTYVLPAAFSLPVLCGKTDVLERVTDIRTLADAVEELSAGADGTVTGRFTAQQELSQLLSVAGEGLISGKELNREALTEFLTQAKRIYTAGQSVVTQEYREQFGQRAEAASIGIVADYLYLGKARICYGEARDMLFDLGPVDNILKEGGNSMSLFGEPGRAGYMPKCRMAISATARESRLAEEFLRLIFSQEQQEEFYYDGFPVNAKAFETMCLDQDNQISMGGTIFFPDGTEGETDAGYPSRETTTRLEELLNEVDHDIEENVFLKETIMQYGPDVLAGLMDVEEGVNAIEKAVSIYLAE